MSGMENISGIDFQITYTVYRLLYIISNNIDFMNVKFEGLDEEGQDLEISYQDGTEFVQVKKRSEGYSWTPSSIRPVIDKFYKSFDGNRLYVFFSDGSLNRELVDFRAKIEKADFSSLEEPLLEILRPAEASPEDFIAFLKKFHVLTRQFVSSVVNDPAMALRAECKALLRRAPFAPLMDVDLAYEKIWRLVFEESRVNGTLSAEAFRDYLNSSGIVKHFQGFPLISKASLIRSEENIRISTAIDRYNIIYIHGLSGVGKSTSVAQVVMGFCQPNAALWFSVAPSHDASNFRAALIAFFERAGRISAAHMLRKPEATDIEAVGHVLAHEEIVVVFDAIEKASLTLQHFISELFRSESRINYRAKLIFVGQKIEKWFSEARVNLGDHVVYHLKGFSYADFVAYLNLDEFSNHEFNYRHFFDQTGGLPIAASLLKNALVSSSAPATSSIFEQSAETVHQMLFANLISSLDDWEREFLEAASVFEESFTIEEINLLLEKPLSSRYKILKLVPTGIITQIDDNIQVHDSIRPLAYSYLLNQSAEKFHTKLAIHYRNLMEIEGHLFELIGKWGPHISKATQIQSTYMRMVHSLSPEELFTLWGIYYRSFPFAFDEDEFQMNLNRIQLMLAEKTIRVSQNYDVNTGIFNIDAPQNVLQLDGADEWDTSFLWYRAERDTPAYHMGYIEVNKPNLAWNLQRHTICPWEHRIEFEPLIPLENEASEICTWFKNVIDIGLLSTRGEASNRNTLKELENFFRAENANDETSLDLIVGSCPIFGHCCPGGAGQALICRRAQEGT